MSANSNGTAIKRFTYDWLIRFAELLPFKPPHHYEHYHNTMDFYFSHHSKFAAISPLFTTLITRYKPFLCYSGGCNYRDDRSLKTTKKCVISVSETFIFENLIPGKINAWYKNEQKLFSGREFWMPNNKNRSILRSDELIYLLKFNGYDIIHIEATSADPIMFSQIWPHVAHCKELTLDLENLVYDDNLPAILRENRICPSYSMVLFRVDMPDEAVLEMVDFFLKVKKRPVANVLHFRNEKPASFSKIIIDRIASSGVSLNELTPLTTPTFHYLCLDSNTLYFCYE